MTLNEVKVQADAYSEVVPASRNTVALRCPRCGHVSKRRRDALAVGLHTIICQNYGNCDFVTDKIVLMGGDVVAKDNQDH